MAGRSRSRRSPIVAAHSASPCLILRYRMILERDSLKESPYGGCEHRCASLRLLQPIPLVEHQFHDGEQSIDMEWLPQKALDSHDLGCGDGIRRRHRDDRNVLRL